LAGGSLQNALEARKSVPRKATIESSIDLSISSSGEAITPYAPTVAFIRDALLFSIRHSAQRRRRRASRERRQWRHWPSAERLVVIVVVDARLRHHDLW
jgi:hypothetical protein